MGKNLPTLFIEIENKNYSFIVVENDRDNFKILHLNTTPLRGISDNKITDFNLVNSIVKKNIFEIEQKFNLIFKDVILIIGTLNCSFINFSGYKKLNGSQLSKENITYLLNTLKSKINEIENKKSIVHIFNSNYSLDNKKTDNLPVGLFGNFYSQEMSCLLINKNDLKNYENIFSNCNLKIKKIISKSFIDGVNLMRQHSNVETFFKLKIFDDTSQLIFFEHSALKFFQNFKFGTHLIESDISKIIGLKKEIIQKLLNNTSLSDLDLDSQNIEKEYFKDQNFRNIKKKLVLEIGSARIEELSEIMLFKNINVKSFLKKKIPIFLEIEEKSNYKCFEKNYRYFFSRNNSHQITFIKDPKASELFLDVSNFVQYGWKREAVPIIQEKKSFITRFFDLLFN